VSGISEPEIDATGNDPGPELNNPT
jgi:hypothetical protein